MTQIFTMMLDCARTAHLIALIAIALISPSCANAISGENQDAAQNVAALEKARDNIEKFRKGDARIKIIDARGKPIKAASVRVRQLSHDFKFGCYLKINDLAPEKLAEYERRFKHLFNFAVVGTYWDFIETRRGAENWNWFERETALARKMNLRVQAAPLLWGTSEAGTPKWLPRDQIELNETLKNRVQSMLTQGGQNVDEWEIVNETLAPKADLFAAFAGKDYIEKAFATARQTAPDARRMINEYGVFGSVSRHNYNRRKYLDLLRELLDKKVPVDVIGIQAHANGEWFAPANVATELERYAELGKPLQITEFSAQTLDYDDRKTPLRIAGDYRAGVWNDARQAEFYREFYTVAFGSKNVEAITTWGLDDARAWLPGIGLINENGAPKAAYQTLDKMINGEWKTNVSGASDAAGIYQFRGFYGDYEIETNVPNSRRTTSKFTLQKNAANDVTIQLRD